MTSAARPDNPADHDAFADAHILMHRDLTAEKYMIADAHVAAEHDVVGKGDVIAQLAIVTDVGSDHEKTAFADTGYSAAVFGPRVHGHAFAQFAARPYHQPRGAAAIMDRLRRRSERHERIDDGPLADRGDAADAHMGDETHAAAKLDIGSDQAIRPDLNSLS